MGFLSWLRPGMNQAGRLGLCLGGCHLGLTCVSAWTSSLSSPARPPSGLSVSASYRCWCRARARSLTAVSSPGNVPRTEASTGPFGMSVLPLSIAGSGRGTTAGETSLAGDGLSNKLYYVEIWKKSGKSLEGAERWPVADGFIPSLFTDCLVVIAFAHTVAGVTLALATQLPSRYKYPSRSLPANGHGDLDLADFVSRSIHPLNHSNQLQKQSHLSQHKESQHPPGFTKCSSEIASPSPTVLNLKTCSLDASARASYD